MMAAPAPILVVSGPSGAGKTTTGRLVAAACSPGVHIRMDEFMSFIVSGLIDPWRPEAAHQNEVLGGAAATAALHYATGGYTVVFDGHVFPHVLDGLAEACSGRGVPLHYAVLRADLDECMARAGQRSPGEPSDPEEFARLHARFADLGDTEAHVVDSSASPDEVAAALLAAFTSGRLEWRIGAPR